MSSLKNMFQTMKRGGYIVKELDLYLMSLNEGEDRRIDINAPSQAGVCLRARYYARTATGKPEPVEPRSRRIFDNGTKTHERLQEYLKAQGMLLMDEVPVHNFELNIQGHTDGILNLGDEYAVLEIKSINSKQFADLKDAKDDHKKQGLVYLYCLETHRQELRRKYRNENTLFSLSRQKRLNDYAKMYEHLKDGSRHTRLEKIKFQVGLHERLDKILWSCEKPISKVVFLYENKDTQDLKEFVIASSDAASKNLTRAILDEYGELNLCVANDTVPSRTCHCKSDNRWCSYKDVCWE